MVQRSQTDFSFELKRFLTAISPSLTVFSSAGPLPPIELLELCVAMNKAFAVIFCLNVDSYWVHDDVATRYRNTLPHARRCYFKSHGNWRLAEKQLGCEFRNAEIVANAPTLGQCRCTRKQQATTRLQQIAHLSGPVRQS